ncbi:MoaD/ThiS family protein [Fodinibius sp.]|uniref:MoaD/ThiS family protein n=1 Tax=Fodinibius sp. TaxID=1872440 RepID=UPI002ACD3915|nr:MoaD/ThiS family protein [Fodinibius sp.]MDZ7659375.1 MoaD/ThiS family protein [Fodinibius sp.]
MTIKVKLFGILADNAQANKIEISDVSTTEELLQKVNRKYPSFESVNYKISVNQDIISNDQKISTDDEIALLPPFSGG